MEQNANKQDQGLSRRDFLKFASVLAGTVALSACGASSLTTEASSTTVSTGATQSTTSNALATGSLPIPPLLASELQDGAKVFNLRLQQGQSHFLAGLTTDTFGINGSYLGPTLR